MTSEEVLLNEAIIAKIGFELSNKFKAESKEDKKKMSRECIKALNILNEEGLFAYAIWLKSKNEYVHREIIRSTKQILNEFKIVISERKELHEMILDIADNLQKLLLAKQLVERMLIYADYRARALINEGD